MSSVAAPTGPGERKQPRAPAAGERLTQRASLNALASLLDYAGKMLVQLLIVPLLVAVLGSSLYGVWQVLGRLVGYMAVADGRPSFALRLVIANQQGSDDFASKRRCVGSALGVWLLYLPVIAAAGTALILLAPPFLKVSADCYPLVRIACALLLVNLMLANLSALPEAVLRGQNLGYKRMGLAAGLSIVGGALTAASLYAGFGLVGVAGSQVVVSGLTGLFFLAVARKHVPWFGVARPTLADLRRFLGLSLWTWAAAGVATVYWSTDVVVLGLFGSAATVTTYVLTGYAAWATMSLAELALGGATPGLGGLFGQKDYEKLAAVRGEAMALSWLLATTAGSTILLWNRSFITLWVGTDHYAGFLADLLLVLLMVQALFIYCDTFVIESSLKLHGQVIPAATAALACIVLACLLVPPFGIVGSCLALLGGRLVQTISLPLLVRSYLGIPGRVRLGGIARPGVVLALLFSASGYLGQRLLARNWVDWAVGVLVSGGVILLVALVAGLPPALRTSVIRRVSLLGLSRAGVRA